MELPIFRELESAWFRTGRSNAKEPAATRPVEQPSAEGDRSTTTPSEQARAADPATGSADRAATTAGPDSAAGQRDTAEAAGTGDRATAAEVTRSEAAPANSSRAAQGGTPPSGGPGADGDLSRAAHSGADRNGNGNGPMAGGVDGPLGAGWQTAADDGWRAAVAAADVPVAQTTQAGLPKRTPMAQLVPGGVDKAGTSVQRRTPESVRGLLSAYHRGVQRGRTKDHPTNPEDSPGGQQSSQSGLGPTAGSGQKEHEG
jgi:hypothetical protein